MLSRSLLILLCCLPLSALAANIEVVGLFKGAAVIRVDGQQRMIREGQTSPEGVRVISATNKQVVLEVDGKRHTLGLSRQVSGGFTTAEKREIQIQRSAGQYVATGHINGQPTAMLVDTGATSVALSETDARRLGIDYIHSQVRGTVHTASGTARAWRVVLSTVSVGGISASGVEATVIEGTYPKEVLLGMSFLQHVNMREENGIMFISSKY